MYRIFLVKACVDDALGRRLMVRQAHHERYRRHLHGSSQVCNDRGCKVGTHEGQHRARIEPGESGADEGTRTLDLRFTKPLLFRLSYIGV